MHSSTTPHVSAGRVLYLDGWRGGAILSVLVGHYVTSQGLNLGRFGVELFFVLSGRLMAEILFVRNTPLGSFFPRRITRVYPALFVFATSLLIVAQLRGAPDPTPAQYLSAITFTLNYAQRWIGRSADLDHIWSLCVEEHSYMLLGLIALIHRRRALPLLPILVGLAVCGIAIGLVQTVQGLPYDQVYLRTDTRGASILIGATAYLALHRSAPAILRHAWVPMALAAFALAINLNGVPDPIKYSLGTTSLAISLVLLPNAPRRVLALVESAPLLTAGTYSYSLYLWQQPFYKLGANVAPRLLMLPVALPLAWLSLHFVEGPMRRLLNTALETRKSPVVPD